MPYDALLILSFGGPEGPDDVIPFLENVLRGRNVPRERMLEVAEHYYHFGGVSPINAQNRALIAALEQEFAASGITLPIYWGNRNWRPYLKETVEKMVADGVRRSLVFVTSAFSSYSGCRQYQENLAAARQEIGEQAPELHKLRSCFNHPGFLETMIDRTRQAIAKLPADQRTNVPLLFTAHSIPAAMAATSKYEAQLQDAARMVAEGVGQANWRVVYQSRSGPPSQPWLEPDISVALKELAAKQPNSPVVVIPIGFVSDHMEVLYDLDYEAAQIANELGLTMVRAETAGTHPRFVRMIRELVEERLGDSPARAAVGSFAACPDFCLPDCCKYEPPSRPARS
jgi:ferrochelatase